jgi:hypothetical protein
MRNGHEGRLDKLGSLVALDFRACPIRFAQGKPIRCAQLKLGGQREGRRYIRN